MYHVLYSIACYNPATDTDNKQFL